MRSPPGLGAVRADVDQLERPLREDRQRQRDVAPAHEVDVRIVGNQLQELHLVRHLEHLDERLFRIRRSQDAESALRVQSAVAERDARSNEEAPRHRREMRRERDQHVLAHPTQQRNQPKQRMHADRDPEHAEVQVVVGARGLGEQHEGRGGALRAMEVDDLSEIEIGERVTRDHEERAGQEIACAEHRARRAERDLLGRIRQRHVQVGAVAEVVADHRGQELDGRNDVRDAMLPEQFDDVFHQRPVGNGKHRLRHVAGERAQPGTLSPGHDHGL